MVVGRNRNAQIIVDEDALYHNIHTEQQRLTSGSEMFMVVKADAYGHGAVQVAHIAKKAGATGFCVAILDEAIQLREAGFVDEPILVLGLTDVADLPLVSKYDVTVTVSSTSWLAAAAKIYKNLKMKKPLKLFLALDTGMGRIGLQNPAEVKDFVKVLNNYADIFEMQGVFTHFATADSEDDAYFNFQLHNFDELMAAIPNKPRYISVANTATSLWHKITGANLVRFGIAGYGINPSEGIIKAPFTLKPAMSFTSELVYVKKVNSGRSIGYGATYNVENPQWIGTVPVGYADGVRRDLQGFNVLINGEYCPIVGRVCMDQLMVKLPRKIEIGTKVTLLGEQKGNVISITDMAKYCNTISYEIACGFSNRLPRVYKAGNH